MICIRPTICTKKKQKKTNVREDQREGRLFHSIRPSYDSDVVVDSIDI